jgi:hypothetical protein
MKKVFICLIICLFFSWMSPFTKIARAQESNPCKPDPGTVIYNDKEGFGFDIAFPEEISPPYPIVFGQDLEKKTGVTIKIEIKSTPGMISYETFDGYSDECIGYPTYEQGMKSCPPYYSKGIYYCTARVPKCTTRTENEVYRTISGESMKVWLVPSPETLSWLRWDTNIINGKYPLRDLFPEKWSLGTWTPGGFTTVGSDLMYTEEQIDQFIAENPDFEFLKSDPRVEELPSYALVRVQDPTTGGYTPMRALGLFGEFYGWYRYGHISSQGECLVNRTRTYGVCGTETNISRSDPSQEFFNADLSAEGITDLRLGLYNIPVDLPGEWYVGVSVSVRPAKYDNGRRTEVVPDSSKTRRYPGNGYDPTEQEHTFIVYVLVSAPCNSAEVDGCTM